MVPIIRLYHYRHHITSSSSSSFLCANGHISVTGISPKPKPIIQFIMSVLRLLHRLRRLYSCVSFHDQFRRTFRPKCWLRRSLNGGKYLGGRGSLMMEWRGISSTSSSSDARCPSPSSSSKSRPSHSKSSAFKYLLRSSANVTR